MTSLKPDDSRDAPPPSKRHGDPPDGQGESDRRGAEVAPERRITVFGRSMPMPRSRWLRITIGIVFVLLGCLGFLPILGFWMIPLGLLILSYEFASIRRFRRRSAIWWGRRRNRQSDGR